MDEKHFAASSTSSTENFLSTTLFLHLIPSVSENDAQRHKRNCSDTTVNGVMEKNMLPLAAPAAPVALKTFCQRSYQRILFFSAAGAASSNRFFPITPYIVVIETFGL